MPPTAGDSSHVCPRGAYLSKIAQGGAANLPIEFANSTWASPLFGRMKVGERPAPVPPTHCRPERRSLPRRIYATRPEDAQILRFAKNADLQDDNFKNGAGARHLCPAEVTIPKRDFSQPTFCGRARL